MPLWIWLIIIFSGTLFALKMIYVLCVAVVLPNTQGALYVSTSRKRIRVFLDEVPMLPGQLLVDLGSGDGRVLRMARKRYNIEAIGYELNPLAYLKSRLLSIGVGGMEIKRKNFWTEDLSSADFIFCYLFPDVLKNLSFKLKSELKSGCVIVSCNFSLPGFTPNKILRPEGSMHYDPIYIYHDEVEDIAPADIHS